MSSHDCSLSGGRRHWNRPLLLVPLLLVVSALWVLAPVVWRQWSDEAWMLEYEQRLQRVLQQPLPVVEGPPVLHWPGVRALQLSLADAGTINLLELLGIRDCELAEALGRHNSSLGRVAGASEQWRQAAEFIRLAPACITHLQLQNPQLAQRLQQALDIKQQQRLAYWWNAWLAGPEWQAAASLSVPVLSREESRRGHLAVTLMTLDEAWGQQQRWLHGDWHDDGRLNGLLQDLLQGESIGRWLVTQAQLTLSLERINGLLAQQQTEICPRGHKTPQGEILQNVMLQFYIGQLQPYLSATDRFGAALLERLDSLWPVAAGPAPEDWLQWLAAAHQQRQRLLAASREHVQRMTAILGRCELAPGIRPPA